MTATNDLERLQRLLDDACVALMDGFLTSAGALGEVIDQGHTITPSLMAVRQELFKTVTALQFQDMATQLIAHTNKRLRSCADQIARRQRRHPWLPYATASYDITEQLTVVIEGINLTNEYVHKRGRFANQLLLIEDSGRRIAFGVRGTF